MSVLNKEWEDVHDPVEVYEGAVALYTALHDSQAIRVKRAEMRQGEVAAEPLDFCVDIELKAKRAIGASDYYMWQGVINDPSCDINVPLLIKEKLGLAFHTNRLGPEGDYRALYWRIRNDQMRSRIKENINEN